MRKLLGPLLAALAALLLAAPFAAADTYTVTRTDDPVPDGCQPDQCSLREALMASNNTTTVDDVVVVPAATASYRIQYEELSLAITDQVEVRGAGADRSVVEGDGKETVFTITAPTVISGITIKGGAGGINHNAALTLRGVSVEHNKREAAGGGIQSNGPLLIESSFLGFNSTPGISGGAIQANSSLTVINSTFTRNSSQANSAILGNGAVTISSSTIAFNESGGVTSPAVSGSPLTVRDSIFAANTNTTGSANCSSFTVFTSLGGNVDDGSSCTGAASDRPNVNPLLGTLALHGGPTQLYDLLPGSPAIDAASQCPPFDQRGAPRPQGAACDSGSYEFVPVVVPPPPDTKLDLRLEKGKLSLTRKGVVVVSLTCLPAEVSPPCSGKVRIKTRKKVELGEQRRKVLLATASFQIAAGKTKKVALRLPAGKAELLREVADARKVQVVVRAGDAAGNLAVLKKPRAIVPR